MAAPGASETVVVVTGGDPVDPSHLRSTPDRAFVVAADSGIDLAQALGLRIDLAIGDFDSVSADGLALAEACGAAIERHPVAKDATDLELALDAALARRPGHIHVVGGGGGRMDHLLASALLLAAPVYATADVTAQMGSAWLTIVRNVGHLSGTVGDLVSLIALHGTASAVTTTGLLYPLNGEDLHPGSSRGISNELTASTATIHLEAGVLVAIQPGPLDTQQEENIE